MKFVNWHDIKKVVGSTNTTVITDATGTCDYFLENKDLVWFKNEKEVLEKIMIKDTISVIMGNWKYYQVIDSMQFWHNPEGSKAEYQVLDNLFKSLKESGFYLHNGYSFFPFHSYTFVRDPSLAQQLPWFFDIKYRDLKIPLFIDNKKIIGFEKISFGVEIHVDSTFYYFIQSTNYGHVENAVRITYSDGTNYNYDLNVEKDKYRSYFCRSFADDDIVFSYKKMPLVSNSMKYPGSVFSSEGRIYKHFENHEEYWVTPINEMVSIYKAIVANP